MKKILSVLLSLCMVISLFSAFAVLESAAYESDEYDAAGLGFSLTVKDSRGLNGAMFNVSAQASDIYALYNADSFDDSVGKHKADGTEGNNSDWTYEVYDYSEWLTDGKNLVCGGFWNSEANSDLPISRFPIDIDINLGSAIKTSGVRLYARTDDNPGFVTKYEVYVKFDGEEDWTYLYTDSNNSGSKQDITTPFAGNMNVTDIRIRVLKSSTKSASGLAIEAGIPAYFYLNKIAVLKPYNNGGAEYAKAPLTYNSKDELDELSVNAATAKYKSVSYYDEAQSKKGMDGDLGSVTYSNGTLAVDFGKHICFSGIRYYPPKNSTQKPISAINTFGGLSEKFTLDSEGKATWATSAAEEIKVDTDINPQFVYPEDSEGNQDTTKPITIKFGRNMVARGLYISSWTVNGVTDGSGGIGDIRLLKAETNDHYTDYYSKEDVLPWSEESYPHITERGKTGSEGYLGGTNGSLFDRLIYFDDDADQPGRNNANFFIYNDYALKDGGTAWFTVDLGEEYEFSAVRIFGRFGQWIQAIREGKLYFSDDGENWTAGYAFADNCSGVVGKEMAKYDSTGDFYTDMGVKLGSKGYNIKARYVKIEATKTGGNHFSAQEIMLVKPKAEYETATVSTLPTDASHGYYVKEDVLPWSEATTPSVTGHGQTGTDGSFQYRVPGSIFDKVIYINKDEYSGSNVYNTFLAYEHVLKEGNKGWITIDLGEEYTFSAVRLFCRHDNFNQSIKEGTLYFSDDGTIWGAPFESKDNYTGTYPDTYMVKYESTGDIYTDMGVNDGENAYNVTARYIKLEVSKSGGNHFAIGELMLVKPKDSYETKDVDALNALFAEKAEAVDALIEAIGTVSDTSGEKIKAAREAYDALPEYAKTLVTKYAVLTAAEAEYASYKVQDIINKISALPEADAVSATDADAVDEIAAIYGSLPEDTQALVTNYAKFAAVKAAVAGLIYTIDMGTSNNYLNGLKCAEFTLTVPDGVTVSKVVFNDTEYTEDGGWFSQSSADGKLKLTLTGSYKPENYGHGGIRNYLKQGKKVWARQDLPGMGIANGEEITLGKGKLTNLIIKDNPVGENNFVTVVLSDGSEKTVNLKTTNISFKALTNAASTGAADELTPNSSWKAASTIGGKIERAFDGVTDSTSATSYWETDYVPGKYQLEDSDTETYNVVFYTPGPFTFYVDLGDNEVPYSGMRFYPRINSTGTNVGNVSVYGSDSLDGEWTYIGNYDLTSQDISKALNLTFFEDEHTVNYKFIRCNVLENRNKDGVLNISGIAFVKPSVKIDGSDVFTVDTDDNLATEAEFKFNMREATAITSVKKGGSELNASLYTFDTDTLTFTLDYVKSLPEGKAEFDLTFDNGDTVKAYIEKKKITVADYYITGTKSGSTLNAGRGSDELVLTAPGKKQASKLEIGSYKMPFTQEDNRIIVKRYDFRGYEGLFDAYRNDGALTIKVSFTDGAYANYVVSLYGMTYKITEAIDSSKYLNDEIVAKSTWTAQVDSVFDTQNIAMTLGTHSKNIAWHSGYTAEGTTAFADTRNGHYMDIDLGEETEISGLRYYKRSDGSTGSWNMVSVYGRNSEDDAWEVLLDKTKYSWNYNEEIYKNIEFDGTAKCRYIRIKIYGTADGAANDHATCRYLRLLKPKTAFKDAEVLNDPVPMDFDLNENANVKLSLNDSKAVKAVKHSGVDISPEYIEIAGDVISISPYYFKDNGYKNGDEVEFTVSFVFGKDVSFKVKVGAVDGYTFSYEAGANGTVTAQSYNEMIGVYEDKTSPAKVRNTDKLTFTAVADEGYEVDAWEVVSTTPVYERIPDSAKKEWSATSTSSFTGSGAEKMIDGSTDNYWHSDYTVEADGKTVHPNWNGESIELIFDFGGTVKNANSFSYMPRVNGGNGIKGYRLYVMEVGNTEWTLVNSGTLSRDQNMAEITLDFDKVYDITQLKYEILSAYGGHAYIREVYLSSEKLPTGTVTRVGTGSEDFEIDERFTDMAVTATFKKMAEGKASVLTELTNLTSDAPASAAWGEDLAVTFTPEYGYHAPVADKVFVTMDGIALKAGVDYVYDRISDEEATLTVKNVSGKKLVITAAAKDYKNHKVIYADNYGATGSLPETVDVIEGEEFTVAKSSLKLTGYKFVGWSYGDETYQAGDKLTMGESDITLEAVWEKDSSQKDETGEVDKPSSGGSSSGKKPSSSGGGIGAGVSGGAVTGSITVTVDGVAAKVTTGMVVPEPAAKEGYTFGGYYLDEALTVPYANTGVQGNVTLYTSWIKNRSRADLTDISGHWAENYIGSLYEAFLINGTGDGKFNPDSDITRAEFIQILYNMSKMTSDGSQNFDDVKTGDWFSQAVAWAVNYGVTSGTSDKTFSPYEKITREQMATMIYRFATLMGADWQTDENGEFADNSDIADYAKYQVRWAKGNGIISGRPDGSFGPKDNATRAESAAMLSRLVK